MTIANDSAAPDAPAQHAYEGPDRWLLGNDGEDDTDWFDELGFLVPTRVPGALHLREALTLDVVMIVGEPWAGKTHVSQFLQAAAVRSGGRAFLLSLEERRQSYVPQWIGNGDLTRGPAWCFVDAADEGVYSGISVVEVLETLRAARATAHPLRVVVLSRNDASLTSVQSTVERIFGTCAVLRLLPMDRDEAQRGLAAEAWQTLCSHLAKPALRHFARYHVATRFLSGRVGDVAAADVWRGMLEALCAEKRAQGGPPLRTTAAARVRAAERFAAVSLLARQRSIDLEGPGGRLLPPDLFPRDDEQLRRATSELRYTSLLKRTADGQYRFRHRFAEEILAALATRDVMPESLHSLVTGPDGSIRDDLIQYAVTLAEVKGPSPFPLLQNAGHVSRFSREEVRTWIDRLVAAAGRATPWISGQDILRWFNIPALGEELTARVLDRTAASGGRHVLFDIAQVNRVGGVFADGALSVALAPDDDIDLRERAVYYLSDLGTEAHVRALMPVACATPSSSVLRAKVLQAIVERGLGTALVVASLAERPEPHHYDARSALVSAIEASLTKADALLLVKSLSDATSAAELRSIDDAVLEELRTAGVKRIMSQADLEDADVDALLPLVDDDELDLHRPEISAEITAALRDRSTFRRAAFARLANRAFALDRYIGPDDFGWLVEDTKKTGAQKYLATIYRLRAHGVLAADAMQEATELLQAYPDELGELDRDWAQAEEKRAEWQRRYPPRKPPVRRVFRDVLRAVLDNDLPASQRLRALGAYCFAKEGWARGDIDGSFDDLAPREQDEVVAVMASALRDSTPTVIPTAGSSFPTAILYEAAAATALVLRRKDVRNDSAIVERWLPTLLFDLREDVVVAVKYLLDDHRQLVERAAIDAIRREFRAGSEHVHTAYALPVELWTPSFLTKVAKLVVDVSAAAAPRRALMLCLADRARDDDSRAQALEAAEACFPDEELKHAALQCMAALDPRGSWPRLKAALRSEGDLKILRPWFKHHETPSVSIDDVADVPLMEDIIAHFFAVLGNEPEELGPRVVTPADDARALRSRFLNRLFGDRSSEARAAVERLAVLDPRILQWQERVDANQSIRSVLEELEARWIPCSRDVVRALDESLYRFLRSEADLHRLAREILSTHVVASIGNDVEMLWSRTAPGEQPKPKEAALQAYVRRRLEDLVPLYSPLARIELPREQQVQRRRRFDALLITALPEQRLGSVVVEIKWSHDARVRTALRDQLATKYLIGEGRTHGLYVVGMTKREAQSAALLQDLTARRDECVRQHPSLTIDIVPLPCQWSDDENDEDPDADRSARRDQSAAAKTKSARTTSKAKKGSAKKMATRTRARTTASDTENRKAKGPARRPKVASAPDAANARAKTKKRVSRRAR